MGPEGTRTYWRRRVVLLAVLTAMIMAVVWLLTRGGDSPTPGPSAFDPAVTAPAPAPSAPSAEPDTATSAAAVSAAATPSTPAADPDRECAASDLTVAVSTDAVSYGPDAKPRFALRVENVSGSPCTVVVGSEVTHFEVRTAAGETVWDSRHCARSTSSDRKVLKPGTAAPSSLTWHGAGSAPECPSGQPRPGAGEYTVVATLGDISSAPKTFAIR